jgi:hypothetical protein
VEQEDSGRLLNSFFKDTTTTLFRGNETCLIIKVCSKPFILASTGSSGFHEISHCGAITYGMLFA